MRSSFHLRMQKIRPAAELLFRCEERESGRERERDTDREKDIDRERETDSQTETKRDRNRVLPVWH